MFVSLLFLLCVRLCFICFVFLFNLFILYYSYVIIYRPQLLGGQVQRAKPYTYQPFCKAGPLHAGLLQALHMRAHLKWCQSEHHRHMHLSPRLAGPRSFHQRHTPRLHHTASGCMAPRRFLSLFYFFCIFIKSIYVVLFLCYSFFCFFLYFLFS